MLLTNSVHLLREYALEHAGIVCLPTLVAGEAILSGTLQLVLPEHQLSSFWLSMFYPTPRATRSSSSSSSIHSSASFSGVPPWDQALIERELLAPTIIE